MSLRQSSLYVLGNNLMLFGIEFFDFIVQISMSFYRIERE